MQLCLLVSNHLVYICCIVGYMKLVRINIFMWRNARIFTSANRHDAFGIKCHSEIFSSLLIFTCLFVQILTLNDMLTCIKLTSALHFRLSVARHKLLSPKYWINLQRPNTSCDTLIRRNRTLNAVFTFFWPKLEYFEIRLSVTLSNGGVTHFHLGSLNGS